MMHAFVLAAAALLPQEGQRLDVLFIGDRGHHRPAERLHDVYGPLLRAGFAVDWEEDLEFVTAERLADYDAVCMYANQPQHRVVPPGFMGALKGFVQGGGGFVALHCTSGCFMESQDWLEFVGARFRSHESEVFQQEVVRPEHAIMAGWENFRAWDETYVQDHHAEGREVLTVRGDEPWSWVKDYGQGRIFYTASGHDERVWRQPAFLDLLIRSLDWAAGEDAAAARKAWHAPVFETEAHGWVPNYEGHQPPPPYQKPSTPEQARRALVVPAGFEAVLFAAEPMVVNPIAMDWDARGRLWVIESPDYPNGVAPERKGGDRISILTDEDGDGRADKKQVFYEGLNLPTSLLVVPGAVLVTQAPDLLALLDEDGDDRCDSVRTVLSGFGTWDTHAGPSNLTLGPDNAIWGSVGYANFTGADGKAWGSGLWRLLPDAREPEFVAQFTNNTWGLGMRPDGEIFGSTANGAPSFFVGAPKA
ncbi:MAG: ThuA domain-containing protein, partial [Planctomycetota bacterium]